MQANSDIVLLFLICGWFWGLILVLIVGAIKVSQAMNLMQDFLDIDVKKSEFRQEDTIDQETFNSLAGRKLEQKSRALKAFKLFDVHNKGLVVLEDLQRVAADLDESLAVEELEEMIREVDQSGDGFLTPQDFLDIAKKVQL